MELTIEILLLSIALAMDAFAIAITLGMSGLASRWRDRSDIAFTFGFFQALMFVIGVLAVSLVGKSLANINSFFAFTLLSILGIKMIKEAFEKNEGCQHNECLICKRNKCLKTGEYRYLTLKILLIYGTATSIDSMAAGVYHGLLNDKYLLAAISIGAITFLFSFIGATSGLKIKNFIGNKANILGGVILLILAIKSLI